ncbi:hypothetical protein SNEBB_009695 [Seison nebaliae]|nr:hypothetical protein SNEBB_009695 [Seison nebaliae]
MIGKAIIILRLFEKLFLLSKCFELSKNNGSTRYPNEITELIEEQFQFNWTNTDEFCIKNINFQNKTDNISLEDYEIEHINVTRMIFNESLNCSNIYFLKQKKSTILQNFINEEFLLSQTATSTNLPGTTKLFFFFNNDLQPRKVNKKKEKENSSFMSGHLKIVLIVGTIIGTIFLFCCGCRLVLLRVQKKLETERFLKGNVLHELEVHSEEYSESSNEYKDWNIVLNEPAQEYISTEIIKEITSEVIVQHIPEVTQMVVEHFSSNWTDSDEFCINHINLEEKIENITLDDYEIKNINVTRVTSNDTLDCINVYFFKGKNISKSHSTREEDLFDAYLTTTELDITSTIQKNTTTKNNSFIATHFKTIMIVTGILGILLIIICVSRTMIDRESSINRFQEKFEKESFLSKVKENEALARSNGLNIRELRSRNDFNGWNEAVTKEMPIQKDTHPPPNDLPSAYDYNYSYTYDL